MDDITRLKEMIASHNNQLYKTKLYISISYQDNLYDEIIKLSSPNVILYIRDKPTTQFMHYKMLVNDIYPMHKNDHILFTDDDDILDPKRNLFYSKYLDRDVVKVNSIKIFGDYTGFNKENVIDSNPNEYVNLCIRLSIVHYFLNNTADDDLNTWIYDCVFNNLMSINIYQVPCHITLYYYRKHFMKPSRYVLSCAPWAEKINHIKI
jgi:hypothetical protein